MKLELSVKLKIDGKPCDIGLQIPTTDIKKENPVSFVAKLDSDTVLAVVYGSEKYYLVEVKPPQKLLAGISEYVESVAVRIEEGGAVIPAVPDKTVDLLELGDASE